MPFVLALPIILRIASTLVFLVAVIVAAALNRSVMMVPLLAAAATLSHWVAGKFVPNPLSNLEGATSIRTPMGNLLGRLAPRFLVGVFGYGILFALAVLISAVFQETELERAITRTDFIIIGVASVIAIILSVINAYTAATQVTGIMSDLQQAFSDMQDGQGPDQDGGETPFTFEGEIIDPDD